MPGVTFNAADLLTAIIVPICFIALACSCSTQLRHRDPQFRRTGRPR
jgi:hypothetical protein